MFLVKFPWFLNQCCFMKIIVSSANPHWPASFRGLTRCTPKTGVCLQSLTSFESGNVIQKQVQQHHLLIYTRKTNGWNLKRPLKGKGETSTPPKPAIFVEGFGSIRFFSRMFFESPPPDLMFCSCWDPGNLETDAFTPVGGPTVRERFSWDQPEG